MASIADSPLCTVSQKPFLSLFLQPGRWKSRLSRHTSVFEHIRTLGRDVAFSQLPCSCNHRLPRRLEDGVKKTASYHLAVVINRGFLLEMVMTSKD
ncbi:unnamed protein product [Ixodes pacificus]